MRRLALLSLAAVLAGCSPQEPLVPPSEPTAQPSAITEAPAALPENKFSTLADAYGKVLDNPGSFEFNKTDRFQPTGTFSYALAEVTGDDSPELLVKEDAKDYYAPVTVFSQPEGQALFNTREVLIWGAGSAGGGRADIATSGSGNGLYQYTGQSVSDVWDSEHFVVSEGKIVPGKGKSKVPFSSRFDSEHLPVTWIPTTDRQPLEQLRAGSVMPPQQPAPGAAAAAVVEKCGTVGEKAVFTGTTQTSCKFAKAVALAAMGKAGSFAVQVASPVTGQNYDMSCSEVGGDMVCTGGNSATVIIRPAGPGDAQASAYEYAFEGTVVVKGPSEVDNGYGVPNGERSDSEYLILVLDAPQVVTAPKAGSTATKSISAIGLGKKEYISSWLPDTSGPWRQYVGKRIRLHANSNSMYFQSDASLPMGMPRIGSKDNYEVEVLN
ncbi:hypothetical protein CKALI_03290 [Corynebacterium kalinowskii]|uniref:Uncharacterized protein n=1 Tax=Corynebacterium kalinowskii TaxID=2675216 RepID=A0A6B8VP18_9CORY|nr:hypothetical protein [Corynebacterium kalinowskii]QGU01541.1 hypothetical protein CKALI_03290 [Corynebacterium kalinowskii]